MISSVLPVQIIQGIRDCFLKQNFTELYLKRVVVGGFERVFEINLNFRNESLSTRRSPEFTVIEFYQAYADYNDMMELYKFLFVNIINH